MGALVFELGAGNGVHVHSAISAAKANNTLIEFIVLKLPTNLLMEHSFRQI